MTPNDILLYSDQSLVQPSSEKLPPATDGNKYRDPQPDYMQRVKDLRTLSPKQNVSIKSFRLELREPHGKGGRKCGRALGDGEHQENKAL